MELFIKNMVSLHCKLTVKFELEELGLHCTSIEYGKVSVLESLSANEINDVRDALRRSGLQLLTNKKSILVEKIKNVITDMVHHTDAPLKTNFSDYLTSKLNFDYTYLANIFSEVEGSTIEQFIILNKICRVKELIGYDELNLTEISLKMHYSSVAHLSTQFKKVTGVTPSSFKQLRSSNLAALENV